jgi:hypothetical protein
MKDSLKDIDPKLRNLAVRVISQNPDGMARMHLRDYFENSLTQEEVEALGTDIYAAIKTPSPADTMFANEIRMGAMKALVKYHFKEGIDACIILAKSQSGHGSETRTGEIMKDLIGYGSAARPAIPSLKELIDELNDQCERGEYPAGELNNKRTGAVEDAIKAINAATTQPEMRSIGLSSAR